jgi:hypothetical protein
MDPEANLDLDLDALSDSGRPSGNRDERGESTSSYPMDS